MSGLVDSHLALTEGYELVHSAVCCLSEWSITHFDVQKTGAPASIQRISQEEMRIYDEVDTFVELGGVVRRWEELGGDGTN